jgi:hypothetical protein
LTEEAVERFESGRARIRSLIHPVNRWRTASCSRLMLLAFLLAPSLVRAQTERPPATSTSRLIVVNALLGGLSAGVSNAAGGRSFLSAFVKGSGGGVVAFAGKKIIAEKGALAAWSGRQVAALGAAQVRNAGAGRPMFEQLVFPLGPTRIYVNTKDSIRAAAKLDITALVTAVMMANRPNTSFDPASSFSNGAMVFRSPWPEDNSAGAMRLGVLRISDPPPPSGRVLIERASVVAHEVIHLAQYDFVNIALSDPIERWALTQSRVGKVIHRYVDFSSASYVWASLNSLLNTDSRPWEREAVSLAPGY